MRLRKGQIPIFGPVRGVRAGWRQQMPVVALSALLSACTATDVPSRVSYVPGFYGGAVADEPTAATVGRNVLSSGGSAADAAVAACERSIQVHGGIGFTWEHVLHEYYKRALWIQAYGGHGRVHRARIASWLLD